MANLIKKYFNIVYKAVRKRFADKKYVQLKNELTNMLRAYFEGDEWLNPIPGTGTPINRLEITRIRFKKTMKGVVIMEIHSCRPGLLIGKGGGTIKGLETFLNGNGDKTPVKIKLVDDKMWNHKQY